MISKVTVSQADNAVQLKLADHLLGIGKTRGFRVSILRDVKSPTVIEKNKIKTSH